VRSNRRAIGLGPSAPSTLGIEGEETELRRSWQGIMPVNFELPAPANEGEPTNPHPKNLRTKSFKSRSAAAMAHDDSIHPERAAKELGEDPNGIGSTDAYAKVAQLLSPVWWFCDQMTSFNDMSREGSKGVWAACTCHPDDDDGASFKESNGAASPSARQPPEVCQIDLPTCIEFNY